MDGMVAADLVVRDSFILTLVAVSVQLAFRELFLQSSHLLSIIDGAWLCCIFFTSNLLLVLVLLSLFALLFLLVLVVLVVVGVSIFALVVIIGFILHALDLVLVIGLPRGVKS